MGTDTKLWAVAVLSACAAGCTQGGATMPGPGTPEEQLRASASGAVTIERGGPSAVITADVALSVPAGASARAKGDAFLAAYASVLGVDPAGLAPTDEIPGDDTTVVVYEQRIDGVPVLGSDVRVEVSSDDAEAEVAMSRTVPTLGMAAPSATPSITADAASATVRAAGGTPSGTPSLVFVDTGLLYGGDPTGLVLAWAVTDDATLETVYVDAQTGAELFRLGALEPARNRMVYTAEHAPTVNDALGGTRTLEYTETGLAPGASPDADTMGVYTFSGQTYDYYATTLGRDGPDGHGGQVTLYSHLTPTGIGGEWVTGRESIFFEPGMVALDVVAHEWTHGVIEHTAKLTYAAWPGAMNESLADTMAMMIDRGDWELGEDTTRGVVRDFADPTRHGQPRTMAAAYTYAAGAVPTSANDALGVHSNSGIFNYAAYLMTEGGGDRDSGAQVAGMGSDKAQFVFYRAMSRYLGSSAGTSGYRSALRTAAFMFARRSEHGITAADCGSVLNACAAVGIGTRDTDSDCYDDAIDNCPMVANFDQADENHDGKGDACQGDAAPMCRTHLQRCSADSECCLSAGAGTNICELGECVDGTMCSRIGAECAAQADCCEGDACAEVGVGTGDKRCCARNADICARNADCCGAMTCDAGHCVCRAVGAACSTTLDCCGSAFCSGGVCATH